MASYREIAVNGLWKNNPGLVQLLGLCPLLGVSNSMVNALGMGIATALVLAASNAAVALIRRQVTDAVARRDREQPLRYAARRLAHRAVAGGGADEVSLDLQVGVDGVGVDREGAVAQRRLQFQAIGLRHAATNLHQAHLLS